MAQKPFSNAREPICAACGEESRIDWHGTSLCFPCARRAGFPYLIGLIALLVGAGIYELVK